MQKRILGWEFSATDCLAEAAASEPALGNAANTPTGRLECFEKRLPRSSHLRVTDGAAVTRRGEPGSRDCCMSLVCFQLTAKLLGGEVLPQRGLGVGLWESAGW